MATSAPKAVPKAAAPVAEEAPAKKSNKKLILIVALVVVLLAAGAGAYFLLGAKPHAEGEKTAKVEHAKPPVFVTVEPFTVNLNNEGGEQFLQLAFTLQVANNEQVDLLKLYNPQVRSRLLLLLSSKKSSEINTPEGKKKLGTEIMAAVNQPFKPGGKNQEVTDVFFTSFVIQ